jgi:hypothetical protein
MTVPNILLASAIVALAKREGTPADHVVYKKLNIKQKKIFIRIYIYI